MGIPESSGDAGFPPLERRTVETLLDNGVKRKVPAFDKSFAKLNFSFIRFYLVRLESAAGEPSVLDDWEEFIQLYRDDLKWLLTLPHYKFWSIVVHSEAIPNQVLTSYLIRAPRPHDPQYKEYLSHPRIGPLLSQIHECIFRIFLRISTFKETKEDHISPDKWASLIYDHKLFDIPKLLDLVVLYGHSHRQILTKMIDNVLRYQPQYVTDLNIALRIYIDKWLGQRKELAHLVRQEKHNFDGQALNLATFEDVLLYNVDQVVSLCRLLELQVSFSAIAHSIKEFETTLAINYEQDVQEWRQVLQHLPRLERFVNLWRIEMLKLFRLVLTNSTIQTKEIPQNSSVDDFFGVISNCLELHVFMHDYNKIFPFLEDITKLRKRGVYIDPTRVEYLSNAFDSANEACGSPRKTRSEFVEPKKIDPLDDLSFDRQSLGACSLDIVGPELDSLVSQVRDLLPDLPDAYIEVCLKHFGYEAETVINAILEGTVPTHFEKYKDTVQPVKLEREENGKELRLLKRNNEGEDVICKEIKQLVLEHVAAQENRNFTSGEDKLENSYLEKSLLPTFRDDVEYDDEYDDTYDEVGMGMTEPDAMPLNPKLAPRFTQEVESEEEAENNGRNGRFEAFVEDPAVVRARMEQKRAAQHRGYQQQSRDQRDVKGVSKGHGQSADVVLNRRRKDEAGSHNRRKRADFKRREF